MTWRRLRTACVLAAALSIGSAATAQACLVACQPQPTPCPSDLTSLVCQVVGGTAPTPTAPSSSPAPRPAGTRAAAPAPAAAARPAGGPTPGALPRATLSAVAAHFSNAPFVSQLLGILAHPASASKPDLLHFRPGSGTDDGRADGLAATARPLDVPTGLLPSILLAALAGLVAAAAITARTPFARPVAAELARSLDRVRALHHVRGRLPTLSPRRRWRLAAVAVSACVPLLLVSVAATSRHAAPASKVTTPARGGLRPTADPAHLLNAGRTAPSASAVAEAPEWVQLVAIERTVTGLQDQIAAEEAQIARLARIAADGGAATDGADAPPSDLTEMARIGNQLSILVNEHSATAQALQQSLEAEYTLYRSAAEDPAAAARLVAAAQHTLLPDARAAVLQNLQLVQTQLSQEAAISQAEGKLQRFSGLNMTQIEAIRHHSPFITPLEGVLGQPFGPTDFSLEPPLTYDGVFSPHFHTGVDIDAPFDAPVHAAADGVVVLAAQSVDGQGHLVGYGNYVVIAHPQGFLTLYGHLDKITVKAGQRVHQGEVLGLEGSTGWSTGPHVHFEIRHDGQFVDPYPYIATTLR